VGEGFGFMLKNEMTDEMVMNSAASANCRPGQDLTAEKENQSKELTIASNQHTFSLSPRQDSKPLGSRHLHHLRNVQV